eukprot:3560640-Prymnesium_polylepis.2
MSSWLVSQSGVETCTRCREGTGHYFHSRRQAHRSAPPFCMSLTAPSRMSCLSQSSAKRLLPYAAWTSRCVQAVLACFAACFESSLPLPRCSAAQAEHGARAYHWERRQTGRGLARLCARA